MTVLTNDDIENIIGKNNLNADTLENEVVKLLYEKDLTVATAESCTGGLVSERITSVSGAGEVFGCGICSYANEIKMKVLGVSEKTLTTVGAVSPETAIQMADGVRNLAVADIGVSTTGIAGPTGGTAEKPVGTVFVGVSTKDKTYAMKLSLGGEKIVPNSRGYIRRMTSNAVLFTILNTICEDFKF